MNKAKQRINNKGASLVTVIITVGFVGVLVSIVMMVSLINFKMKRVNAYAKDTFYSAEQVLDEINIGLQRYASDSLSVAYMDVMENYAEYSTEKKNAVLQTAYYESMWEKLQADSGHHTYDIATLEAFLKESTKWRGDDEEGYGAVLRVMKNDGTLGTIGEMVTYDKTGIVLKNLRVYYKDSKGYVSVIQTDIRISYPQYDFAPSTALPDIADYCIIADGGIKTNATAGDITLEGNIYGDNFVSVGTLNGAKMHLSHEGEGQVVLKHDLELDNATFSCENEATFWAENVIVDTGRVTLAGESNVADDINIKGNGSTVTLAGTYNGYGNSLTEAENSSAILVNGTNSTLDMSGIEKITIAGHAYVGTKAANTGSVTGSETGQGENVFTGESIAVKSNQLLYLVPGECIGVDKTTGTSKYNKNPLTASEYTEIMDASKYEEISLQVAVDELGGSLSPYIKTENGLAQAEKVFIPTNYENNTLVYYYMKFDNEDAANKYFAKYYQGSEALMNKYASYYADMITFPSSSTLVRLKFAGNGVEGSQDEGYELQSVMLEDASTKLSSNQQNYAQQFSALCTKLISNYDELTVLTENPDPTKQIIYENLIDEEKLNAFIDDSPYKTGNLTIIDGSEGKAVVSRSDYTITDNNIHLVIAKGDVTIAVNNFTGTVFSDGKVSINTAAGSVKADPDTVKTMLRYYQTVDGENVMLATVLQGGSEFIYSTDDENGETESTSLRDLIVYENWKKE